VVYVYDLLQVLNLSEVISLNCFMTFNICIPMRSPNTLGCLFCQHLTHTSSVSGRVENLSLVLLIFALHGVSSEFKPS
jgi:hypothetical protein